jgi:ABC-type transporter Mla subunit MlaD
MQRNIVIFLIIIILFIVLALIGFLIYRAQAGFSRGRGSASETSGEDV